MASDNHRGKTGIFYTKDPGGVIVMKDGEILHQYKSVNELVEAHVKGVAALEREMEELLARHYRPD